MSKFGQSSESASKSFDPNAAATYTGIFGLPEDPKRAGVVLLPVPWDVTCSYGGGTSRGPRAMRKASTQVDLYDPATGKPYEAGIYMPPEVRRLHELNRSTRAAAKKIIARGGNVGSSHALKKALASVNAACASMNSWVYSTARTALEAGKMVGVVGGDHSVPFGAIQAYAERYPCLGILHIDAHADLRAAYEGFTWSHASIMHNVIGKIGDVDTLIQVGVRDWCEAEALSAQHCARVHMFSEADIRTRLHDGETWRALCEEMIGLFHGPVYVSFDIDGLDPALCPHTGTPVPGGLSFREVETLLALLSQRRRIVGFDLCEVAPGPRGDEWDGNVGARILYKLIGYALLSQTNR